jgi:homocysteine S-methyltransferase
MSRLKEMRCNGSSKSHAELDGSTELDRGDLVEFGKLNGELKKALPGLKVFGGCCGTDLEHLDRMAQTLLTLF